MIDEKKIEEAATYYAEENPMDIEDQLGDIYDGIEELSDAYKAGARWAINEFLDTLWHNIFNERIPSGKRVIVEYTYKGGVYYRSLKIPDDIQCVRGFSCEKRLMRWLYIDDLFPKKGGGEQ